MSQTLFIQVGSVGVQGDLYNIYYTVSGGSSYPAVDANGNAVSPVTVDTLLNGFYIVVPDNTESISICVYGGPGDGRCYLAYLPTVSPSATPTTSVTPSITPTTTPTVTPTRTVNATPSISTTASLSTTPSKTPTPTVTPTISTTASISVTPSVTPTISTTASVSATPSVTPTISTTASISVTPSISTTASISATPSVTPTISTTASVSVTPTISTTASVSTTPSVTPTISTTASLSVTPTPSVTPTISITASVTPSISTTASVSATPSVTPTISITASVTPTPSVTPTISITASVTPTISTTASVSATPSVTPTISITASVTPTPTKTPTPTPTISIDTSFHFSLSPINLPSPVFNSGYYQNSAISRTTGQYQVVSNSKVGSTLANSIYGYILTSGDYGASFQTRTPYGVWSDVSVSDNGQYMLAVEASGKVYKSSNYGGVWTDATSALPVPPGGNTNLALSAYGFTGCSISSNGQYQVLSTQAVVYPQNPGYSYTMIFKSSDYGVTWSIIRYQIDLWDAYTRVKISSDGNTIYFGALNSVVGPASSVLYRSTNGGATFASADSFPSNITDISISGDATNVLVTYYQVADTSILSPIRYSKDSGVTFGTVGGSGLRPIDTGAGWRRVALYYNSSVSNYEAYALLVDSYYLQKVTGFSGTPSVGSSPTYTQQGKWMSIAVAQSASSYVLLGGDLSTTGGGGLLRSTDGGGTFNYIANV